jgi:hypothetical protein
MGVCVCVCVLCPRVCVYVCVCVCVCVCAMTRHTPGPPAVHPPLALPLWRGVTLWVEEGARAADGVGGGSKVDPAIRKRGRT